MAITGQYWVIYLGIFIHPAKYELVSLKSVDRLKTVYISIFKQSNMFATGVTFKYYTKKEGFILVTFIIAIKLFNYLPYYYRAIIR